MSLRTRVVLVLLVVVGSLDAVFIWSLVHDQLQRHNHDAPIMVSGSDVGFQVGGHKQERRTDNLTGRTSSVDIAVGQLVVRINGEWVEAQLDERGIARPATN